MRSFRARIERGRIIVHEPLDLPDGVVYLVAMEKAKGEPAAVETNDADERDHLEPPLASNQRSSS